MAIELSTITFTDQDDIVPPSGVEEIVNTDMANTLAGNDVIIGTADRYSIPTRVIYTSGEVGDLIIGTYNTTEGIINTNGGNDIITGISQGREGSIPIYGYGIYNDGGTIDTGDGNDIVTGIGQGPEGIQGIISYPGGIINSGNGNDTIMGTGSVIGIEIFYSSTLDTGNGNDIIAGTGDIQGLVNTSTNFNTGDGNDTIIGHSKDYGVGLYNAGFIDTGNGNDIITGIMDGYGIVAIQNAQFGTIDTGNGNDIITSIGLFSNEGIINTGSGNDSIIAEGGFSSGFTDIGRVFLQNGKDYCKGFGGGIFNGGNGKDTLELTSGSYTVGISGTTVNFTKGSTIMKTSEFEKLIAGSTTYDFSSLTNGQTIFVA